MTEVISEQPVFTLTEAAYALGENVKNVIRLVDEHPDLVNKTLIGKRGRRVLGTRDLVYMQAVRELRDVLTPVGRRQLHEALLVSADTLQEVTFGSLKLPLEPLEKKVQERIDVLDRLKDSIEGDPEDPFIKQTNVEVYRIAALLAGGATVDEVKEDYPLLSLDQIKNARDYAQAIPKQGHPYPGKSFKRATRELNLHLIDELLAEEDEKGDAE
jgi:uncharacterized protein (DUF433 family)